MFDREDHCHPSRRSLPLGRRQTSYRYIQISPLVEASPILTLINPSVSNPLDEVISILTFHCGLGPNLDSLVPYQRPDP